MPNGKPVEGAALPRAAVDREAADRVGAGIRAGRIGTVRRPGGRQRALHAQQHSVGACWAGLIGVVGLPLLGDGVFVLHAGFVVEDLQVNGVTSVV